MGDLIWRIRERAYILGTELGKYGYGVHSPLDQWLSNINTEKITWSLGWCGLVDWALACELDGCRFDSRWGCMLGLWARSPVGGVWEATDWCFSCTYFFPSLSPSLPLSLKINKIFKKSPEELVRTWYVVVGPENLHFYFAHRWLQYCQFKDRSLRTTALD